MTVKGNKKIKLYLSATHFIHSEMIQNIFKKLPSWTENNAFITIFSDYEL